jgi:hypothetical protein
MICKKCKKPCIPIGATLRGVQLVGCPVCGLVYTDMPTVKQITRQVYDRANDVTWKFALDLLKRARDNENPKIPKNATRGEKVCSTHTPATNKKTAKRPLKKVVVKKTKVTVKSRNKR